MRIKKYAALTGALALAAGAVICVQHYSMLSSTPLPSGTSTLHHTSNSNEAGPQLWHCGMHPQVIQNHPGLCPICHMPLTPMSGGQHSHGQVTIDPTVVQNMGLRTSIAARGPLNVSVQTAGMLKIPEPAIFDIVTQTNGWITQLNADTEGMHVRRGDVLFKYYSPDVHQAEAELIQAVRAFNLTKSDWVTTRRTAAQLVVDDARRKCRGFGLDDSDIDPVIASLAIPDTVSFRSPASGTVSEKTVVHGSSIWSGIKIMRIEEHSQLWLDCDVYEDQMASISVGNEISATFDAIPGRTFTGKVAFIFPHVEPMTRAEMVRVAFDNADLSLKPGMYATVSIHSRPLADAVLVPQEAVIDTGSRQLAFVALPGGHFDARQVRVGLRGDDDQLQILSGISSGESVVTSGQFLLDVESRTLEAIDKLRRPGDELLQPTTQPNGVTR
jgi:Cu(I)/Ag(I) efflux system membrane fusion protein